MHFAKHSISKGRGKPLASRYSRVYTVTQLEQSLYLRSSGEVRSTGSRGSLSSRKGTSERRTLARRRHEGNVPTMLYRGQCRYIRTSPLTVILRIIPATQRWSAFNWRLSLSLKCLHVNNDRHFGDTCVDYKLLSKLRQIKWCSKIY